MASLASVFARISNGAASVSTSDAQKSAMKAGGFGMFSLTGGMVKKGAEKALAKADANGDGRVDVDEFSAAIRTATNGKRLPTWAELDPAGSGALSRDGIAELVKAAAKAKGGALGGMVDASGIAKLVVALADDDGDGQVSKAEFESLRADL